MFFKELVEQHRVHRVVANRVRFALLIASHQIGIYLFHVLSHESEFWSTLGIDFLLVAERDRFEGEDYFACVTHRLDLLLETPRGANGTEVTCGIYLHYQAFCDGCRINSCDICIPLSSFSADADGVRFDRDPT